MSSKVPVGGVYSWISAIPQILVLVVCIILVSLFAEGALDTIFWGCIAYLILSVFLRRVLTKYHIKGISLIKKGGYNDAIPCFQASYRFFSRYKWIDQYRYLTLLSSSEISYQEMALCNIAFCYIQIGDRKKGKEYYQRALKEFPDSGLATTALKFFEDEVE